MLMIYVTYVNDATCFTVLLQYSQNAVEICAYCHFKYITFIRWQSVFREDISRGKNTRGNSYTALQFPSPLLVHFLIS